MDIASLGARVRRHRGSKTLREVAAVIGIGTATLMRVEAGRIPDLVTFGKLCHWLGEGPGAFLGFSTHSGSPRAQIVASGPPTVEMLTRMILGISRRQCAPRETPEECDRA